MFDGLKNYAATHALRTVQATKAPQMIGSSLGKDWLIAYFGQLGTNDRYMFDEISGQNVKCLRWNNDRFSEPTELSVSQIDFSTVEFHRWFDRLGHYTYFSLRSFMAHQLFRIHNILNLNEILRQWLFNKRFRLRDDRNDVLLRMYEASLNTSSRENKVQPFVSHSALQWFFDLHGSRSAQHPEYILNSLKFKSVLLSLEASGDLTCKNDLYAVTGGALKSLADFELEERRHRQQLWTNKLIAGLTAVIVITTIVDLWMRSNGSR